MLNAPTDLRRSQQLLHDATQIMTDAATSCAHSRVLVAGGKARAVARARAAVMYDETFPEGTVSHASEHEEKTLATTTFRVAECRASERCTPPRKKVQSALDWSMRGPCSDAPPCCSSLP